MGKGAIQTDRVIEQLRINRQKLNEKCIQMVTVKTKIRGKEETNTYEHRCSNATDTGVCQSYAYPDKMWRIGNCLRADEPLRTPVVKQSTEKVRVGQQKQHKH